MAVPSQPGQPHPPTHRPTYCCSCGAAVDAQRVQQTCPRLSVGPEAPRSAEQRCD